MQVYLAPLQGLTDWIFREAYTQHISQFDKVFSPFIRVQDGEFYRPSQCNDILPEHNIFQRPIPQFLGNDADSFFQFEELCLKHGYSEVNINLGCPFPKVSGKGLGAGLLNQPEILNDLLDGIFKKSSLQISVKCRLGNESIAEIDSLLPVLNSYPLQEVIIHARLGKQQYKGDVDLETFEKFGSKLNHPVVYNGDLVGLSDFNRVMALPFNIHGVMIGRGALKNPFLPDDIRGVIKSDVEKRKCLIGFNQAILDGCSKKYSGDRSVLHRLTEMWEHHAEAYVDGRKIYKQVKKSTSLGKNKEVVFDFLAKAELV